MLYFRRHQLFCPIGAVPELHAVVGCLSQARQLLQNLTAPAYVLQHLVHIAPLHCSRPVDRPGKPEEAGFICVPSAAQLLLTFSSASAVQLFSSQSSSRRPLSCRASETVGPPQVNFERHITPSRVFSCKSKALPLPIGQASQQQHSVPAVTDNPRLTFSSQLQSFLLTAQLHFIAWCDHITLTHILCMQREGKAAWRQSSLANHSPQHSGPGTRRGQDPVLV